jgi:type IV pilus assembly protein PilF
MTRPHEPKARRGCALTRPHQLVEPEARRGCALTLRAGAAIFAALLAACAQTPRQQAEDARDHAEATNGARVHTELAAAWYGRRRFDIAVEETNKAILSAADYVPAYNMRGLIYMEVGEDNLARQAFERALEIKPGDAETSNNFGWFLCNRSQPAQSLRYFALALEDRLYQSPDKPLVNAGICSRKLGEPAKAENFFRRALLARPEQPLAHFNLAELAYQRGDLKLSKNHLDRAFAAGAVSAEMLWLRVRLERKLGERSAEASAALQLRRRFPQSRETQLLMREVYD